MPTTPFPNLLLDKLMPALKDTEWRLLCVIVRQTLGWKDGRERKASDWLTHAQLRSRTGRSSEAVSHALDVLVRRDLVEVWSDQGMLLATPEARRRASGRLTFRLSRRALAKETVAQEAPITETETGLSESETRVSETGIRKAKTTKETEDKKTPDGVSPKGISRTEKAVSSPAEKEAVIGAPLPEVRQFLEAYRLLFARQSSRGEPPPLSWGRDGKLVKGLLHQYGYERLLELLERFFESEDAWVKKRGYALSCFPTALPQLLMEEGKRPELETTGSIQGKGEAPWQRAGSIPVSEVSLFERYPELAQRVRGQPP